MFNSFARAPFFLLALGVVTILSAHGKMDNSPVKPMKKIQAPTEEESRELRLIKSNEPHKVILLNSGVASLEQRLRLIESAKESIEIEYFIYREDLTSRLFTNALIRKANQNVKIRILVDGTPLIWTLKDYHAQALLENGIELKFFNITPLLVQPLKSQYRNHRKLMVVDDRVAIVGGRNIGDEYFDLSPKYNFIDREIVFEGPMAKTVRKSFELFWNSLYSEVRLPKAPTPQQFGFGSDREARTATKGAYAKMEYLKAKEAFKKGQELGARFVNLTEEDIIRGEQIRAVGSRELAREFSGECLENVFFGDLPTLKPQARIGYEFLLSMMSKARKKLSIESPYFIIEKDEPLLKAALDNKAEVRVLTNSFYSTDAFYAATAFYNRVGRIQKMGAKSSIYNGEFPQWLERIQDTDPKAKWAVHAKSAVVDESNSVVMSYNIDPRSENWNSELGFACFGNAELALAIEEDIKRRENQSIELSDNGQPRDGRSLYFKSGSGKVILAWLLNPIVELFSFML